MGKFKRNKKRKLRKFRKWLERKILIKIIMLLNGGKKPDENELNQFKKI